MYDKNKLKKIIIATAAFILLVVVTSVICIVAGVGSKKATELPSYFEDWKNLVSFENRFHLDYPLARYGSNLAISQLEKAITKESELATVSNQHEYTDSITATIVDGTFKMPSENPEVYTFNLSTSDKREYKVWVIVQRDPQSESVSFMSTAIKRDDSDRVLVYASNNNADFTGMVKKWLADNEAVRDPEIEIVEPEQEHYDTEDNSEETNSYDENGNRIAR